MTKLLFLGDMANTGFGTVTMDLGRELLALGVDVRFMSLNEEDQVGEIPELFASRTAMLGEAGGWLEAQNPLTQQRLEGTFTGGIFEDGWTPDVGLVTGDMG